MDHVLRSFVAFITQHLQSRHTKSIYAWAQRMKISKVNNRHTIELLLFITCSDNVFFFFLPFNSEHGRKSLHKRSIIKIRYAGIILRTTATLYKNEGARTIGWAIQFINALLSQHMIRIVRFFSLRCSIQTFSDRLKCALLFSTVQKPIELAKPFWYMMLFALFRGWRVTFGAGWRASRTNNIEGA